MGLNFYKHRVCFNVLANRVQNAREIDEAAEGHVLVGLLAKNYKTVEEAIQDLKRYDEVVHGSVSLGLGNGDPLQWRKVADICRFYPPPHVNQVFTAVGYTRAALNHEAPLINSLVSPSGQPGFVRISTGPLSEESPPALVPIDTAIAMVKDMGGNSIKFFPMKGLTTVEEFKAVAEACREANFCVEPTGGLNLANYGEILQIALQAGVPQIIPHIYSSIVDPHTGDTDVEQVKQLWRLTKKWVGACA
ncbi:2-dehydro-3-deoxy-phosphogluconate aldolase [Kroppenstedtia sanguinis]|uniref:KDGP aldolase family protein n=1 Tax=Kroppenstedtia sanguinis TaxID=1380684 RepID=A0ABW4CD69_9BACL